MGKQTSSGEGVGATSPVDRNELRPTRAEVAQARHLPGKYYTSQEIFELEVEKLFMKDWLVVGRLEEFQEPGDYRVMEIVGESIILCRDREGRLNALSNNCRHRGVEVACGEGNRKNFMCPYHGWVYDLNGNLIGLPGNDDFEGFDQKGCHLPKLRVDTWGGFIFINFDPDSPSLPDYLAIDGFQDNAGFLHPEDTRLFDTYTCEIACNWKLIPENLIDIYHVNVIHKNSFGKGYRTEKFQDQLNLTKHGWFKEYESNTMAPDGELLFGPMPWLEDRHSRFAFSTFLRPNFNLFARQDLIQPFVTYPLGPDRSRITVYTLLPEGTDKKPAFRQKVAILHDFLVGVIDEDSAMLASIQKGFGSRYYVPGPMHPLEKGIHHRINAYLDAMLGDEETL